MNYTVKSGDTLSKIAATFGVTVAQLATANGIADIHNIPAGRTLIIPAAGVTLNSNGTIIPPTPVPTIKPTTNWWDGFTQALAVGLPTAAREYIGIEDAKAERKRRIAAGLPISPHRAEDMVATKPVGDGVKTAVGYVTVGLLVLIGAAMFLTPTGTSSNSNRRP